MNEPIDFKNEIDQSQDIDKQQNKAAAFGGGKYRIDYDRHQNADGNSHESKSKKPSVAAVLAVVVCTCIFILCGVFIFKYFASTIRLKVDSQNDNYSLVASYEARENRSRLLGR